MIFCEKTDCIHRSKRKSSSYTLGGRPAYKCKKKHIVLAPYCIGDCGTHIPLNRTCECLQYQSLEEEQSEGE